MATSDLITLLRSDLADPGAERFSDEVLTRCILKSAFPVGRDLGLRLGIDGGEITPEPQDETLEMLLLQARIEACRYMRAATASAFSFSSGDKRVDKTSQPEHWAKLESDLTGEYKERLSELSPEGAWEDDYIITPHNLQPLIYEQGRYHHCRNRHGHSH